LSSPRPISGLIAKVGRAAFAKKGFAAAEVITRWPAIVGETVAVHNGFFGYRAVVRLRLMQRPIAARAPTRARPAPPPLSPRAEAHLHKLTAAARDDRLKAALDALGREILGRQGKP
jgi:hypothetical protein